MPMPDIRIEGVSNSVGTRPRWARSRTVILVDQGSAAAGLGGSGEPNHQAPTHICTNSVCEIPCAHLYQGPGNGCIAVRARRIPAPPDDFPLG